MLKSTCISYSFVIPTLARRENIFDLVETITTSHLESYEIIIVIQLSGKNLSVIYDRLREMNTVKIVYNRELNSIPLGRNIGAKNASGNIICFIDDDVTIDNTFLEYLKCSKLASDTIYFPEIKNKTSVPFPLGDHVGGRSFVGACFLIGRETFLNSRGMDPDFLTYRDDSEFFIRMKKSGFKLEFITEVYVWHPVRFTKFSTIMSFFRKNELEPLFHKKTGGVYDGVIEKHILSFLPNKFGFSILTYFLIGTISLLFIILLTNPSILIFLIFIYVIFSLVPSSAYFVNPQIFLRSRYLSSIATLSIYFILFVVLIPARLLGSIKYKHFTL
jgi:GT2 family glycosyltransferase